MENIILRAQTPSQHLLSALMIFLKEASLDYQITSVIKYDQRIYLFLIGLPFLSIFILKQL